MKFKLLAGAGVLAAVTALAGCASGPQTPYSRVAGDYQGLLPCADCSGIQTNLHLVNNNNISGSFVLKSVRNGQSNKVLETKGNFLVLTNAGPQKLPIVYQLKGSQGNTIYNLRPLDSGDLEVLTNQLTTPDSSADVTLKRQ